MAGAIPEAEMEEIRKAAKAEFPNDPALQQVHMARKIISAKARREGLSFFEYIRAHQGKVLKKYETRKAGKP